MTWRVPPQAGHDPPFLPPTPPSLPCPGPLDPESAALQCGLQVKTTLPAQQVGGQCFCQSISIFFNFKSIKILCKLVGGPPPNTSNSLSVRQPSKLFLDDTLINLIKRYIRIRIFMVYLIR